MVDGIPAVEDACERLDYHSRMRIALLLLVFASFPASADVRLSKGKICHDASSQHYASLQTYQAFKTMQDCLAAGGRLSVADQRKADARKEEPSEESLSNWIVWTIAAVVVVAFLIAVALPFFRSWLRQRKNRQVEEEYRDTGDRRWRGHRLDRKDKL
jgi:hypothetical protein